MDEIVEYGMKQKVLFIDQYNKIGGGQNVLIDLINTFSQLGYECTAAIPRGGYIESRADARFYYLDQLSLTNSKKGVFDVVKLGIHYLRILPLIPEIKKTDLVYINGSRYFIWGYILSKLFKKKFIYHIHIDLNATGKNLLTAIWKEKRTTAFIFTSNFLRKKYLDALKSTSNEKLYVIEPSASTLYSRDYMDRFQNDNVLYNFISIGRIIPEKGFEIILDTAYQLPLYNFFIVGAPESDTEGYFQELVNKAPSNVKFVGSCTDIPAFIQNHNIQYAIIPSKWDEPFGMVAIEAMLCSCITFVEEKGGLAEIASQTNAVVFDSPKALINEIQSIIQGTAESKRKLAFAQYSLTKTFFSREKFAEKISAMITDINGKR